MSPGAGVSYNPPCFNSPLCLFLEPNTAAPLSHCHFVQNVLLKLEPKQKQMPPSPDVPAPATRAAFSSHAERWRTTVIQCGAWGL